MKIISFIVAPKSVLVVQCSQAYANRVEVIKINECRFCGHRYDPDKSSGDDKEETPAEEAKEEPKCSSCSAEINEKIKHYSQDKFGRALCMRCQNDKRTKEPETLEKKAKTGDPIAPKYIKLKGKDFVTHAGLLDMAHKKGLITIKTDLINWEKDPIIVKAEVTLSEKTKDRDDKGNPVYFNTAFTAYGDASDENVNDTIKKHKIRMAETRAINRALRFATNIGMTSIDELENTEDKK